MTVLVGIVHEGRVYLGADTAERLCLKNLR